MVFSFTEIIKENLIYILIAAVVIIAFIIVCSIISNKKKNQANKQLLVDLTKEKDELTKRTVEAKLARIEYIGKHNVAFNDTYLSLKQEYDSLIALINSTFNKKYGHASRELENKNYKVFKETCSVIKASIEEYKIKVAELENKINVVVKDDESLKNAEFNLSNRLQKINEEIVKHNNEIEYIKVNINSYIATLSQELVILSEYINNGNYYDANDLVILITNKIEFLEKNFDSIAKYALVLTKTLPSSINDVIDKYKKMISLGYPLKHINLAVKINECTETLKKLISKLKKLEIDDFDAYISRMIDEIGECDQKMELESEAKKFFDEFNLNFYEASLSADREYIHNIKEAKEVQKEYESNEERQQLDHTIKTEVQKLAVFRRDLDSLNYGNQPYSLRMNKLKELEQQTKIVKDYLKASYESFDEMRKITDDAKDLVNEKGCLIRNLEIAAINTKLEKIVQTYQDDFQNAYRLINRINNLIALTPVDIDELTKKCESLKEISDYLSARVNNDVKNSFKAESLIKYANNFRPLYGNIAKDLAKAEIYFYDGKYIDCIDLLKESLVGYDYAKYLEGEHKDEILG